MLQENKSYPSAIIVLKLLDDYPFLRKVSSAWAAWVGRDICRHHSDQPSQCVAAFGCQLANTAIAFK